MMKLFEKTALSKEVEIAILAKKLASKLFLEEFIFVVDYKENPVDKKYDPIFGEPNLNNMCTTIVDFVENNLPTYLNESHRQAFYKMMIIELANKLGTYYFDSKSDEPLYGKIYIKIIQEKGLYYEVIGPDRQLKKETIAWDKFPKDDIQAILKSRSKLLSFLLDHTLKAGHTLITPYSRQTEEAPYTPENIAYFELRNMKEEVMAYREKSNHFAFYQPKTEKQPSNPEQTSTLRNAAKKG